VIDALASSESEMCTESSSMGIGNYCRIIK
jgi:hypothetical protein